MKEYEKPQRSQSKFNSLCSPKEFPLKEITERIISCNKFQCRKTKRWDKKIGYIRGHRGEGEESFVIP